jgi:hypothetical protein
MQMTTRTETEAKLDALSREYAAWNKAQGLNLGSADEHLFDDTLTDHILSWPSENENEGGAELSGDLIWYLLRHLTFEKCKTAEGHSGWVITIKGS